MARVVISTAQALNTAGLNPALTAPTVDGDSIPSGNVFLWVENASGGSITVTVQTPGNVQGLAIAEAGGPVPAGQRRLFGPFPKYLYGQDYLQSDAGMVRVDYSAFASVTRGVFSL